MSQQVNYWLVKTEPGTYSFADLQRDGRTVWDGVKNALALKYLRQMRPGDQVFIYHSVSEKAVVGIAAIDSEPYADPRLNDPQRTVVDMVPVAALARAVSLADLRADPVFSEPDRNGEVFALLRMSRLSVMPVSPVRWRRVVTMAGKKR